MMSIGRRGTLAWAPLFAPGAGTPLDTGTRRTSPRGRGDVCSSIPVGFLRAIADDYGGGPVGIETLAAALAEQRDTLEEVVEPYLIQQGLVQRTPRGRMLAVKGWRHLGIEAPVAAKRQLDLLTGETEAGGEGA